MFGDDCKRSVSGACSFSKNSDLLVVMAGDILKEQTTWRSLLETGEGVGSRPVLTIALSLSVGSPWAGPGHCVKMLPVNQQEKKIPNARESREHRVLSSCSGPRELVIYQLSCLLRNPSVCSVKSFSVL